MADFGLIRSFNIDHGELDGLSQQQCFVLGYELGQIDELLKHYTSISRPVHAANRERIEKSCVDAGRAFRLRWLEGKTGRHCERDRAYRDLDTWGKRSASE